jgi:hypothetical protein
MEGCLDEPGNNEAYCVCTLSILEESLTEEEFVALGFDLMLDGLGDAFDIILDAALACLHELD